MKTRLFNCLIVTLLIIVPMSTPAFAREEEGTTSAEVKVDPDRIGTEYTLPYPGLLPDNPFYFLRASRDRIVSFLISDPLKKAEFDLLQANKRLAAGIYLADKKKYELANTAISKGENYFESAISKAEEAKKQRIAVDSVVSSLYHSARKHQEVIKELEEKTKGDLKAKFAAERKRAEAFEKKAELILSQE